MYFNTSQILNYLAGTDFAIAETESTYKVLGAVSKTYTNKNVDLLIDVDKARKLFRRTPIVDRLQLKRERQSLADKLLGANKFSRKPKWLIFMKVCRRSNLAAKLKVWRYVTIPLSKSRRVFGAKRNFDKGAC